MIAPAAPPVPVPSPQIANAAEIYDSRCTAFAAQRDSYARRWNAVANWRLLAFALAAAVLILGTWRGIAAAQVLGIALLAVFAVLVAHHVRLGRIRRRYAELWQINDEARKRLARDWDALPIRHTATAPAGHPYAADLDIFGPASLFHLLDTTSTQMGETTLRDWLLAPASPAIVAERRPAVAELGPLIDFRDELAFRGRLLAGSRPDPTAFLRWAESAPWLRKRPALLWAGRVSTLLLWICLIAQLTGLLDSPWWGLFAVVNGLLRWQLGRPVRAILTAATTGDAAFRQYGDALEAISTATFAAPLLARLQAALTAGGLPAHQQMRRLGRRTNFVFPEDHILNVPIQLFTLWDFQVLAALERWQSLAGPRARGWLAALGEVEALAALSVLVHDDPAWAFPDLAPAAPALEATALAHPLLPAGVRVANNVTVGPPGTFLLVTGSNMSGKSTLLRAVGVNIVLAGAGGPVCAAGLRLPPVTLWTSMRIQDSLARGVSYFMAELERLKAIVDAARAGAAAGGPRLFYLLDEILQGTNTAERQVAARRIIAYLVAAGALGAVSTHDLALADAPEMAALAHPVHFTERFTEGPDGPRMTFDYRLRPGIATSTNALRLMQLIGLDLKEPAAQALAPSGEQGGQGEAPNRGRAG